MNVLPRKVALLALALLPAALAQADLTLSPARLDFALSPGGSAEERVVLRNGLPREEPLQVRLLPFTLDPRGNVVETTERNLCPHLEVVPTALVLPPGGSAEVRVRARAPKAEGTLACLVVFSASARPLERGGLRLSVRPELGLAVYLTLKGTEAPALRAKVGGVGEALPLFLENPGNVLQRVSGEARVFTLGGEEAARLPLAEIPVFPGGYRELALKPDPALPKGRYRVVLLLTSAYGRYAAEGTWDVP